MTPRGLRLVALGEIGSDPDLPRWLAAELAHELGLEVRLQPDMPIDPRWREPESGNVRSNLVVDDLAASEPHGWTLAVTDADLVAPGRRFVFGEATLGGPVALVGLARLHSADLAILRLRALKESLHEIGHLAGLGHCLDPRCVMAPSSTVRAVDLKRADFCGACRRARAPLPP